MALPPHPPTATDEEDRTEDTAKRLAQSKPKPYIRTHNFKALYAEEKDVLLVHSLQTWWSPVDAADARHITG